MATCRAGSPARKVPRYTAEFPKLVHDVEQGSGWRNASLTDWRLRCDADEYPVHKAIVGRGPRSSAFLAAAFRSQCANTGQTDLSHVLPEACWGTVPTALDFIYEAIFPDGIDGLLPLLVIADVLQMRALFSMSLDALNKHFDKTTALGFLTQGAALRGCHEVVDRVAHDAELAVFEGAEHWIKTLGITAFASQVKSAMRAERLHVMLDEHVAMEEDLVFALLKELTAPAKECKQDGVAELWATCRFACLSASCLLEAATLEGTHGIPHRIVSLNIACQRLQQEHGDKYVQDHMSKLAGIVPTGWLKCSRLHPRTAKQKGLRPPRCGELYLFVYRSSAPDVAMITGEHGLCTIYDFKVRLCRELGLDPSKVRLWDWEYVETNLYNCLETDLAKTLDGSGIHNGNEILLEEQTATGLFVMG